MGPAKSISNSTAYTWNYSQIHDFLAKANYAISPKPNSKIYFSPSLQRKTPSPRIQKKQISSKISLSQKSTIRSIKQLFQNRIAFYVNPKLFEPIFQFYKTHNTKNQYDELLQKSEQFRKQAILFYTHFTKFYENPSFSELNISKEELISLLDPLFVKIEELERTFDQINKLKPLLVQLLQKCKNAAFSPKIFQEANNETIKNIFFQYVIYIEQILINQEIKSLNFKAKNPDLSKKYFDALESDLATFLTTLEDITYKNRDLFEKETRNHILEIAKLIGIQNPCLYFLKKHPIFIRLHERIDTSKALISSHLLPLHRNLNTHDSIISFFNLKDDFDTKKSSQIIKHIKQLIVLYNQICFSEGKSNY